VSGHPSVSVIIPARDEERGLRELLPCLHRFRPGQVVVVDNGSRDRTAEVATRLGVRVVHEPRVGYGAACQAGIRALHPGARVVAFLDADLADDPARLGDLVDPVLADEADLVMGSRPATWREAGSMTPAQRFGNRLATALIRIGWGHAYTDLGPFRAIERGALDRLALRDRRYGWTVEMQIRAVEEGLRIREVPMVYRRRLGTSKISGTVKGSVLAGYWILRTVGALRLTRRARLGGGAPPPVDPETGLTRGDLSGRGQP
jgi:glycosyltransferase involved in cell wall biosynthesis